MSPFLRKSLQSSINVRLISFSNEVKEGTELIQLHNSLVQALLLFLHLNSITTAIFYIHSATSATNKNTKITTKYKMTLFSFST